jgi:toxin CcdB
LQQFDVYPNPNNATKAVYPFVVVMQSDLLDNSDLRTVAPIGQISWKITKLQPAVQIDGEQFSIHIDKMVTVRKQRLKTKTNNIKTHRDDIIAALDLFFTSI